MHRPLDLRRFAPLLLLLAVTAAGYAALWPASFAWDDEALVRDNQWTGELSRLPELFRRDLWSTTRLSSLESGYYRPLFLVTLLVDRALYGLSATGAHVHSLLWHLAAVSALYGLLVRLTSPERALLGAAVFALHPVQSEVLALVAARNDSMAAAMTLGALLLLVDRDEGRWPRLLLAGGLLFGALLSKESAVLAPVMLLALDLGRWRRPGSLRRYAPLLVALVAYVGLRAWAGVGGGISVTAGNLALVGAKLPQLAATYASMLVWPWPLSPARHIHYLPPLSGTLPGLLALLALVGLALRYGEKRGLVLVGLAWAALSFAPTLAATVDKGLLGERYLYFPVAGLALALAAAAPRVPRWFVPAFALPCLLVLQLRLPQWKDSRSVWEAAHETGPTPFTMAGLGWYQHRDGDLEEALPLLVGALKGEPPYRDVCELVVLAHLEAKKPEEAARVGTWAIDERGCPLGGEIANHTALALASTGAWDEAVLMARRKEGGPSGTGIVVVAAAWARAGKLEAVPALAPRVPGPPSFASRVAKLLRLAGETAAADKVLAMETP